MRPLLLLLIGIVCAQKSTCPVPTSMAGMVWQNLKDTLGVHIFVDWLPIIAYGTDPKVERCPQSKFRNSSETCGDLNVSYMYQAMGVMLKAYTGYGFLDDSCVFDACPYITTIAKSKDVNFRTIDCRRATMMLECALYHIPRMVLTSIILSLIFFVSFMIFILR